MFGTDKQSKEQPSHLGNKSVDIVNDIISECVYSSYNPDGVGVLVFKSCSDDGYLQNDNPVSFHFTDSNKMLIGTIKKDSNCGTSKPTSEVPQKTRRQSR